MKRSDSTVYRERALLVGVLAPGDERDPEDRLEELRQLARTAGAAVQDTIWQRRDDVNPGYYVGRGKADELAERVDELDIDVVIFDNELSPAQTRNLEQLCGTKVIDRTELILDIFATRAKTKESKLQVELAQLEYLLPRLRRMWTHLSRQVGNAGPGIGTRGPGEKQIEVDRRIAHKRISDLKRELKQIEQRKRREVGARRENFTLSLVGYTNAGKSTLMNALTGTGVLAEDRLFSTLDTKTHVWRLRSGQKVLLSDTVGFIRSLPHHLVASFHATLEEVTQAHLLLHVVDASHPDVVGQIESVETVLREIECGHKPAILVLNKVDRLDDPIDLAVLRKRYPDAVAISAATGKGLDDLDRAVMRFLEERMLLVDVVCPVGDGKVQAYLAEAAQTLARAVDDEFARLRVRISGRALERLWKETGRTPEQVRVFEVDGAHEPAAAE